MPFLFQEQKMLKEDVRLVVEDVAQLVEYSPTMQEAQTSNSNTYSSAGLK